MSSRAAIRYAKAVLDQANHANISEVVFGDMKSIQATLAGSKELRVVLQSPVVKAEDKKQALLQIFEKNSDVTKALIQILTSNKRINLLGGVALAYVNLYNDSKGVKTATVITAVTLTPEIEAKVLSKLKEMTGSDNITINNTIDEHIIGGFILRVGDLQYNASIANQLGNLKREFSKSL
ncbi:ATP synthase F1 subunit delta [Flavobacteriaceae bacterium]|nr:ATP synthase F1 subunit delta [Flavobacteriaceae bacterium]MDB4114322.1 ATP synthase F1 subunit delta [Flavobacteriaceae bacterium]MDB4174821.1 ATP synthase F1 subunit delta [Flavobacteriaceae bacterium]MDC0097184.1 ATP synthase F1 subunit delta [Flavobacteriaceae bacterium]MDC1198998.1 ATP synthase F1 subunit delta [Flavobacteriaceae bacterium]